RRRRDRGQPGVRAADRLAHAAAGTGAPRPPPRGDPRRLHSRHRPVGWTSGRQRRDAATPRRRGTAPPGRDLHETTVRTPQGRGMLEPMHRTRGGMRGAAALLVLLAMVAAACRSGGSGSSSSGGTPTGPPGGGSPTGSGGTGQGGGSSKPVYPLGTVSTGPANTAFCLPGDTCKGFFASCPDTGQDTKFILSIGDPLG